MYAKARYFMHEARIIGIVATLCLASLAATTRAELANYHFEMAAMVDGWRNNKPHPLPAGRLQIAGQVTGSREACNVNVVITVRKSNRFFDDKICTIRLKSSETSVRFAKECDEISEGVYYLKAVSNVDSSYGCYFTGSGNLWTDKK